MTAENDPISAERVAEVQAMLERFEDEVTTTQSNLDKAERAVENALAAFALGNIEKPERDEAIVVRDDATAAMKTAIQSRDGTKRALTTVRQQLAAQEHADELVAREKTQAKYNLALTSIDSAVDALRDAIEKAQAVQRDALKDGVRPLSPLHNRSFSQVVGDRVKSATKQLLESEAWTQGFRIAMNTSNPERLRVDASMGHAFLTSEQQVARNVPEPFEESVDVAVESG